MTVEVHTYSRPKEWTDHPLYESFPNAIHICATDNQRKGIIACYGRDLKHVYSFRKFIKVLYRSWYSPETKFQQYLRLSKIIADLEDTESELKQAFRKNSMEVLDSIRFLIEANSEPNSLNDDWIKTSSKERVFKKIWEIFIKTDLASQKHYRDLRKPITKERLQKAIKSLNKDAAEISVPEDLHIVLHGFYFVTPEQQIIFEIMSNHDFRITFFHYYDSRYTETFDFIKAFVTDRFGWPSPEEWIYDDFLSAASTSVAHTFLEVYESGKKHQVKSNETIIGYPSFFDFLQDVILPFLPIKKSQEHPTFTDEKLKIISPNAKQLNELLLTYYPELNSKKRNFLSYPIGRFLVNLHQIYKKEQLLLTEEIIMELFSSGWLYDESTNENAQNYTYELEQLFPYLQGAGPASAWINRLEKLIEQGLIIEEAFPIVQENRIVRSMRSPFAKISHFALPLDRIKQINRFLINIQQMAETLFDDSAPAKIDLHFKRLKEILNKNGKGASLIANENERILINELEKKLDQIHDDSEFLYDDLQTALHFYLSGKLDDNDLNFINDFVEIDGEMFKPTNRSIYLTGLDENSLPLGSPSVPWPLQAETFEKLSEHHISLQLHSIRSRANKSISRYLFFIALNLQSDSVKMSWIKNILDQDELQPALYIKQLGLNTGDYTPSTAKNEITYKPYDFSLEKVKQEEMTEGWKTLGFIDFLAEYELCPKRFYYSYIADEYPTFSSDFIHQFLYSEIIRVSGQGTKADLATLLQEVNPLFPQWVDFKKRVSAEIAFQYVPNRLGKKTDVIKDHSYTETRKNFQFPGFTKKFRNELFDKTEASYPKIIEELVDENHSSLSAKPGYECRFCPHIEYCNEAVYSVDLRRERKQL